MSTLLPADPDALIGAATTHLAAGEAERALWTASEAKTAIREVLALAPGHPAATANLGAFLRISGGAEEAEHLLANHLGRHLDDLGTRLNLAADLLSAERSAEALALLDAAAPPAEDGVFRHWVLERSLALLQLGRPADAAAALDALKTRGSVPATLVPLVRWRCVLLCLAADPQGAARTEATAMEEALAAAADEMVPEHALMARFDLAKFWSGQNEPARAFSHWKAGHGLLGKTQPFSRDAHRGFVDASIRAFPHDRFHDGARTRDPAPVFVVGMPRSGTTLVEQIIDAHHDAIGLGERVALAEAAFRLAGGRSGPDGVQRLAALDRATLDAAGAAYVAELRRLAPDASRIVDKMRGNFQHLGLVRTMLPGARIIHCVRDPRDIGLSIFTFRFHGDHGYAHDLADLGWYIGEHDRLMAHWQAALPNPIPTVRLNDWIEDFDATLSRLLAFLDLPADPACRRFHEGKSTVRTVSRAQVRQPINAGGLDRWRAYANELAPLIAELDAGGSLAAWT